MQFLKPAEAFDSTLKNYRIVIIILVILLGASIVIGPQVMKTGLPLAVQSETSVAVSTARPWTLTTARLEGFAKYYLTQRFEWSAADFSAKKEILSKITKPAVFTKLTESLSGFEALAKNQSAKCYYVFEGFAYSNAQQKIEIHTTRVIRINNAAIATPLTIRMAFDEDSLSQENPYGIVVKGLEEETKQ